MKVIGRVLLMCLFVYACAIIALAYSTSPDEEPWENWFAVCTIPTSGGAS